MTTRQLQTILPDAFSCPDRDVFVSDWALSSMFLPADDTAAPSDDLIQQLCAVWNAAHCSAADILTLSGLSKQDLCARFMIPVHTFENWLAGRRQCPPYTLLMLQQCLGLLPCPEDEPNG